MSMVHSPAETSPFANSSPSSNAASANERLNFVEFSDADRRALRSASSTIEKALGPALDRFYARVRSTPETSQFFHSDTHVAGAKAAQSQHWSVICDGDFGANYVDRVTKIGRRHAAIGLEPRWYIGGYSLITDNLIEALVNRKGFISKKRMASEIKAFIKALLIDIDFAVSTYQDASDDEIIGKLGVGLSRMASGDLTHRIGGIASRFGKLQDDYNNAAAHLSDTIQQVSRSVAAIHMGSSEIRAAADDLAQRTERQAASLEQTAAATNQVTSTMEASAQRANEATTTIDETYREASEGSAVVARTVEAMGEIDRSSQEIANIINVIDGIALQTNLLALNAGVEAARAGDAGRGFAVVASEVRALAQRAGEASNDIRALISASSSKVTEGVSLVGEAGAVLNHVLVNFQQISDMVGLIARSAESQSVNLQQVNGAVSDMDRMTQQNAAMVEQSTAATRSLADEANHLSQVIGRFKTDGKPSGLRVAA
jgi:methyl-accepting chemotaxis protein